MYKVHSQIPYQWMQETWTTMDFVPLEVLEPSSFIPAILRKDSPKGGGLEFFPSISSFLECQKQHRHLVDSLSSHLFQMTSISGIPKTGCPPTTNFCLFLFYPHSSEMLWNSHSSRTTTLDTTPSPTLAAWSLLLIGAIDTCATKPAGWGQHLLQVLEFLNFPWFISCLVLLIEGNKGVISHLSARVPQNITEDPCRPCLASPLSLILADFSEKVSRFGLWMEYLSLPAG